MNDVTPLIEASKEIIPQVYEDGLQPAVKEVGKSLQTITKLVNVALAPLSAIVWGYDKIKEFIIPALEKRLKNVPPEKIITPDAMIAGPVLESLRYTGHVEELRTLYANLLASAMNSDTSQEAHPAFTEIIKQLSADEAKILSNLKIYKAHPVINVRNYDDNTYFYYLRDFSTIGYEFNCKNPELISTYLRNLERLGLIIISYQANTISSYDSLINHPQVNQVKKTITDLHKTVNIEQGYFAFTELGKQFFWTVVSNKSKIESA
ncbi:MAG: DUF4393 domain-containing protein [Herbinix sp.]|nr:DUF4393 domain-containing protein [Herbinix sp.]